MKYKVKSMNTIDNLRSQIDSLDNEIASLLLKRLDIVSQIGKIKAKSGMAVFDPTREEKIIKRLTENTTPAGEEYIKTIYNTVFSSSRNAEKGKYGVVGGESLVSKSPDIHKAFGNENYFSFRVKPGDLCDFVKNSGLSGYNVTMPHKVAIMECLDEISPEAAEIGAVNTVVVKEDKKIGYNTDCLGFIEALKFHGISVAGKKVCVLGSGGSSKAVCFALKQEKAGEIVVVSRSGSVTYADTDAYADSQVLINCTPVGYGVGNGETPVCIDVFKNLEGVYDLIYHPDPTRLVFDARQKGINAHNGLYMLIAQAAHAHKLFGMPYLDEGIFKKLYKDLSSKRIVLMGMPGSGKTELGRLISTAFNLSRVDTDEMIEAETGMPVPEIITKHGVEHFRRIEKEVIKRLAQNPPDIVTLGGGAILDMDNRYYIKAMGNVLWIDRDTKKLERKRRPLSVDIEKLAKDRYPIYQSLCDVKISNNGHISDAFEEIVRFMQSK